MRVFDLERAMLNGGKIRVFYADSPMGLSLDFSLAGRVLDREVALRILRKFHYNETSFAKCPMSGRMTKLLFGFRYNDLEAAE